MKRFPGKKRNAGAEDAAEMCRSEKGQTMIEYALVAVLINSGMSLAGSKVNSTLSTP
jgi:Flp pilus assembly pilin Flp